MNTHPHILCIDASNLLHRFFHGMPEMYSHTAGIHTHAITAWTNFLLNIPQRMPFLPVGTIPIVFFDRKRDLVAEGITTNTPDIDAATPIIDYKGQRKPTDEKLRPQLQMAEHLTQLLGIAHVKENGFEADTLLGSVVINHINTHLNGASVHILSTDKDMLQLVQDNPNCTIKCIHPQPGGGYKLMDEKAVAEKMGVTPAQVADLLAMMGDTCDNIPGIPGVGHKTAIKLIQTHGNLDNVIKNIPTIPGKLGEKIRQHLPYIPALRQLVTFKPTPVKIKTPKRNQDALEELLKHLDMQKTLARVK